jgi:hypothetical protein
MSQPFHLGNIVLLLLYSIYLYFLRGGGGVIFLLKGLIYIYILCGSGEGGSFFIFIYIGPSEVRAPAVGVAHAGGERSVHY